MATSADVKNYYIGKGTVAIKLSGDTDYRDVGNVPTFEFTPDLTTLDHFSSRSGVKTKDRTVVVEKAATLKMVMEEWTAKNLAIALLGAISTNSAGLEEIDIFSENSVSAAVKFTGTNQVGPRWEIELLQVDFIPSAAIDPISDEWGQLEVNGNVVAVAGKFGTATKLASEDDDPSYTE